MYITIHVVRSKIVSDCICHFECSKLNLMLNIFPKYILSHLICCDLRPVMVIDNFVVLFDTNVLRHDMYVSQIVYEGVTKNCKQKYFLGD